MTILITGGTGLVGSRLLRRLANAGIDCRVLVRAGTEAPAVVTAIEGDLLDINSLRQALEGVSAVVHLAAVLRSTDTALIRRVNVDGTRNLVSAVLAHASDARMIMASTGLVYDAGLPRPAREHDRTWSLSPYPESKIAAEQAVRESGLTWCILRFAFVYGDGDGHLQAAPQLLGGRNWHPAQTMSLLHHLDLAGAVRLALAGRMDGRVVNISDDAPTSIYEIARIVGARYEESAEPLENPWNGRMDGSLARALGFTPVMRSVHQAAAERAL